MINERELIDRFGDKEFLTVLWRKTEGELPSRVEELDSLVSGQDWGVLTQRLHKLRGLISNFLTSGSSVATLVSCEKNVEAELSEELQSHWARFREELRTETIELNDWLQQEA